MGTLTVETATPDDSHDIFTWRNDPQTRAMSHTGDVIAWEDHDRWFESSLANPNRCLLMCADKTGGEKIAVIRFDIENDEALMSINLAPNMRGKGLASPCMKRAIDFFLSEFPNLSAIRAEIKPVNLASVKAFEAVGFCFTKEANDVRHYKFSPQ